MAKIRNAYDDGYQAGINGRRARCPFEDGSEEYYDWIDGYSVATSKKKEGGPTSKRSIQED